MAPLFDFSSRIFESLFQVKFGNLNNPQHPDTPKLIAAGIMVATSAAVAPTEVIRKDKGSRLDQVVDEKTYYPERSTSTSPSSTPTHSKSLSQSKQELLAINEDSRVGVTAHRVNEGSNDPGIRVRAVETADDSPSQHQPTRARYTTHWSNLAEVNYSPFPSWDVPFGHSSYASVNLENLGDHINNRVQNALNAAFQHHRTWSGSQSSNQEGYLYYGGAEYRVPHGANAYVRGHDIRTEGPTLLEAYSMNGAFISINSGNIITNSYR